ncbi:very short patch repair endonuclease [Patescibacteria group bacterium]|nr:very short patch repair endonuclease [Patescibacteria group bacterium]
MSRIKNKDSKIELLFRKKLWQQGFHYRKNSGKYFGKPDIVLKKYKTVIFIDSCFWHGCKKHCRLPVTHKKYWSDKISKNSKRDKDVLKCYKQKGWKIFRVWEHQIKNKTAIENIVNKIKKRIMLSL